MTATLDFATRNDLLAERLVALQSERSEVQREIAPAGKGDEADRATNVDGHVRLAMLDQRIAAVEAELAEAALRPRVRATDVIEVGAIVTVDFGDGPEDYLLGSVEQTVDGVDVITPGSPLGRALIGSTVGSTVSYLASGRTLSAQVLAAA